jgi:hypothetical protein
MPTPTGKTFNFFLPGVFTSLDLSFFFPDELTTDLFVDCNFGCVFAMTRLIMRMICVVCKSDSLLTTHLTPSVIGAHQQTLSVETLKTSDSNSFITPNHEPNGVVMHDI